MHLLSFRDLNSTLVLTNYQLSGTMNLPCQKRHSVIRQWNYWVLLKISSPDFRDALSHGKGLSLMVIQEKMWQLNLSLSYKGRVLDVPVIPERGFSAQFWYTCWSDIREWRGSTAVLSTKKDTICPSHITLTNCCIGGNKPYVLLLGSEWDPIQRFVYLLHHWGTNQELSPLEEWGNRRG